MTPVKERGGEPESVVVTMTENTGNFSKSRKSPVFPTVKVLFCNLNKSAYNDEFPGSANLEKQMVILKTCEHPTICCAIDIQMNVIKLITIYFMTLNIWISLQENLNPANVVLIE